MIEDRVRPELTFETIADLTLIDRWSFMIDPIDRFRRRADQIEQNDVLEDQP